MALTPSVDNPRREEELKRQRSDPESFGIGDGRALRKAASVEAEKDAKSK